MKKSASVTNTLLLDERPLIVLPKLATDYGLNEAIVLQQIHFLLQIPSGGRIIDGEKWIWNTHEEWKREHFPFLKLRTLRRAIESLERSRLLVSCQPDGRLSRRKYYRINYNALPANSRCGQNGQINVAKMERSEVAKMDSSYTETTPETSSETTSTKESKATAFSAKDAAGVFFASDPPEIEAQWKPSKQRALSKEEQLKRLKVQAGYPSEDEFNNYLESQEHDSILSTRDLYRDLCLRKWRHWNAGLNKWTKIRDWQKYVDALNDKMEGAKCG